jgi:hypothetical protein
VVAACAGGAIASDSGELLGQTHRPIDLPESLAAWFVTPSTIQMGGARMISFVQIRIRGPAWWH